MSFGSLLEYLKYFGPFLVKWDEYENDEKLLARFFLEVSSMSHTLFSMSHPLSLYKRYWSHSTFVAHYHCIFARYFKCIGSAKIWIVPCEPYTRFISFLPKPQTQPHPTNLFCLHVFFSCKQTLALPHDVFCLSGHPKALSLTRNILRTQAITHNNPKCTQINTYMDES